MLEEDAPALQRLAEQSKDYRERERLRALYALAIGESVERVAQIFDVNVSTVYEWIAKWKEEHDLQDEPRSGRPPELSAKDKETIKRLVEEGDPKKHGINAGVWDTKELQTYFALRGKSVSRDAIRVTLKSMGAHYVKADVHYAEASLKLQKKFAHLFFEALASKPDDVVVLFADEMSASCSPKKGYGWTFEKRLVVEAPQSGGRKRLNVFGAVNPESGELVEMASANAKSSAFIKFVRKVKQFYEGKQVWLYVDNGPTHTSAKARRYVENHAGIELRFLPPYSPDLNPKEQWWNFLRRKFLSNKCFGTPHQLATAISGYTRLAPPQTVQSVCSLEPLRQLA